jgi:hypothetical protein
MLIAIATVALALLAVTMIRTSGEVSPLGPRLGGLRLLDDTDRVAAFEDYAYDGDAWQAATSVEDGVGRVLGPFTAATITRRFALPDGATAATLTFDLYLWNDAAPPAITLNGIPATPRTQDLDAHVDGMRRQHVQLVLDDPAATFEVTLTGAGTGQWALDNLSLIATVPNAV